MKYCLYSLHYSDDYLKKRSESGFNVFEYSGNMWKYPDGRCGNKNCTFKHNRSSFIRIIQDDPMKYIIDIISQTIKYPNINLSTKLFIPLRKEAFNEKYSEICMSKYCKCQISKKYTSEYKRTVSDDYITHNTWYAFYRLSEFVADIVHSDKEIVPQIIDLYWRLYSGITHRVVKYPIDPSYCILQLHKTYVCNKDPSFKHQHDERSICNIHTWIYVATRLIHYCIDRHIKPELKIEFENPLIKNACSEFIQKYSNSYIRCKSKPFNFKFMIYLMCNLERDYYLITLPKYVIRGIRH